MSNSLLVSSFSYDPSSIPIFSTSTPILVDSSTHYDSEDENPTLHTHPTLNESISYEHTQTTNLPRWVIQHENKLVILSVILLINFEHIPSSKRASSLLDQVSMTHYP